MLAKTQKISQTIEIADDPNQSDDYSSLRPVLRSDWHSPRERLRDSHWPAFRVIGGRA